MKFPLTKSDLLRHESMLGDITARQFHLRLADVALGLLVHSARMNGLTGRLQLGTERETDIANSLYEYDIALKCAFAKY